MSASLVRRTVTVLVVAAVAAGALLLAARIPRTIAMFLIAAFIAFGAHPLVQRLETRMPRALAIALVYAALLGTLLLVALVIVPIGIEQIGVLVAHAPQEVAAIDGLFARATGALHGVLGDRVPLPTYQDMQHEIGNRIAAFIDATVAQLGPILVGAINGLLVAISALILSVFFLLQGREVRDGLLSFVPSARRPQMEALLRELVEVFGHFVAGQAVVCAIVGAAVWIALAPAHFAFALLVAVVCAFGYAIPFVGMLVAQLVGALLAIPQGTGMVLWVSVAIFVVARVADSVLVPKIMSQSVGVSPITVMFAVFAGGELLGLPGLVLGIPAAALLRVLFAYFVRPYVVRMQTQEPAETHVAVDVAGADESVVVAVSR